MAPVGVDWSAGPPSSSGVRGATDGQTGHGADSLAVFYMVVTETEVTVIFFYSRLIAPTKTVISGKINRSFLRKSMTAHGAFIAHAGRTSGANMA